VLFDALGHQTLQRLALGQRVPQQSADGPEVLDNRGWRQTSGLRQETPIRHER
jgi:hypothetical protein